jgi:hypothetical protein
MTLSESETPLSSEISSEITEYLKNLQTSIKEYFPSPKEDTSWLRNSFSVSIEDLDLTLREFEQLMDIPAERNVKDTLKPATLFKF